MGWRAEVRERLAELERARASLEEARAHARQIGGEEGARLEEQIGATIRETSKQISDLRASLQ